MQNQPASSTTRLFSAILAFASSLRESWEVWRERSVNHKVFAASLVLAALAVVCKLVIAGRELVTAYWFGTGDAIDAFVIASVFPSFAIIVMGRAAGSALLPTLAHMRQHEEDQATQRLLRESTFWCILLLMSATTLLAVTSPWLLAWASPGFNSAKRLQALHLLWLLLPTIVFQGVASLWAAVLHTRERFAATGLIPVLTPLFAVVFLLMFADRWGIHALAIGFVAGSLAEVAAMAWALKRCGYQLLPRIGPISPALRLVAHQYFPLVAAAAMMCGMIVVDNAMASSLGPGNVATLNYGRKLVAVFLSIPALSLSKAIFPYFSQMVTARDWHHVRHTLRSYRRLILLGTIPLTVLLIGASHSLVAFALQRGEFNARSTDAVSWVQIMYALQIPFYTLSLLYFRLVSSLRLNYFLTLSTVISIVANIAMNYLLMPYLGVAGIALSTSFVYFIACIFVMTVANRLLKQREQSSDANRQADTQPGIQGLERWKTGIVEDWNRGAREGWGTGVAE